MKNKTVFDFDAIQNVTLTIHVEMENGKYPPGIPVKEGQNSSDVVLQGKEALLFLNAMQKDFSNNKTKVQTVAMFFMFMCIFIYYLNCKYNLIYYKRRNLTNCYSQNNLDSGAR